MKLFSSDRLFEEAAHSPESFDKLLRKLKRERKFCFIFGLSLGIIPLGFGIPLFIRAMHVLQSPETASLPTLAGHPIDATLIGMVAVPLLIGIISQHILMRHADACIKLSV